MIYLTILNIAIFQGLVLGAIILRAPLFKGKGNSYLAYAIITLSILILNLVLDLTGILSRYAFLKMLDNIEWVLLIPVFILFFILNKVEHPKKSSKKLKLLYVPFLFSALLNIFNDLEYLLDVYTFPSKIKEIMFIAFAAENILILLFLVCVLAYGYSFIKYEQHIKERTWLKKIWFWIFSILFSWVLIVLGHLIGNYDISQPLEILALVATFLIHWTTYFGIFKYKLARDQEEIKALINKNLSNTNYKALDKKTPAITSELVKDIFKTDNIYFQKLEHLCNDKELYRDETLNREKTAQLLEISPGYLSQIINTITGKNFTSYINDFRVEAVKKMILDPEFEKYSLLAIGLESGFTSKTAFYAAFKKGAGMTPNAYKKSKNKF